jgi:hypothetical protein
MVIREWVLNVWARARGACGCCCGAVGLKGAAPLSPPLRGVKAWFAAGELKGPVDLSKGTNA